MVPRGGPKSETVLIKRKTRTLSLNSREREIIELIWFGLKNREIGERLKISVKLVETHRENIMKNMRVSNTAQLLKSGIQESISRIR